MDNCILSHKSLIKSVLINLNYLNSKSRNMKFIYKFGFIILLFFSTFAFSQVENEEIFNIAEHMPRFPGCEYKSNEKDKTECSTKKLMEFIYANIKYPVEAIKNDIQGRVTLRFTVNTDSTISNIEILRDIGGGCGEEAKRVIECMNSLPVKWIPGSQGVRNVNVWYTLPIVFKLDAVLDRKKLPESKITYFKLDNDTVLLKNEELPIFPKFLSSYEDINFHNEQSLNEFFLSNLIYKYPIIANNKSDEVVVEFKVNKKGEIRDVKVIKDFGYGSAQEAIRAIYSLNYLKNKWTPATYKDRKTDSYLRYAVKFQINRNMLYNSNRNLKKNISDIDYADEVFTSCEYLPMIRGCEEFSSEKERYECSEKKLNEFLYSNLHYLAKAVEQGIKGTVIVEFIVNEVGKIINIKIVKDIGGGCGEEVIKIVEGMNKMDNIWIPGSHEGKNVKVLIKYPVIFMLNG